MINIKIFTYILTLILCVFTNMSFPQSLPNTVIQEMTKRVNRYHHFIWHLVRENWNRLSPNAQQEIRDLGWEPPNPARGYSGNTAFAITDNLSGEDFLFMHRQMINKVNSIVPGTVVGWESIPAPGDSTCPVPPAYIVTGQPSMTANINDWKTSSFYESNIRPNEIMFKDPTQLRSMSLAELGARIEVTVHFYMHLRFSSSCSYGYRPQITSTFPDIDTIWDDPQYDCLFDLYSSVINPTFYKIHGWIDNRVEDWRRANGLSNIKWRGTWTGGPMSSIAYLWDKEGAATSSLRVPEQGRELVGGGEEIHRMDTLTKVGRIFGREGIESGLGDVVLLGSPKKSRAKVQRRFCKRKTGKISNRASI